MTSTEILLSILLDRGHLRENLNSVVYHMSPHSRIDSIGLQNIDIKTVLNEEYKFQTSTTITCAIANWY